MTEKKDQYSWLVEQGPSWLASENIRPYIFLRQENRFENPGHFTPECHWFKDEPIYMNPLKMSEVGFADDILSLETKAFQKSGMPMPRWVFYDCAVMPGFVCGFAQKTKTISPEVLKKIGATSEQEWTPLSLFIIIPTIRRGEWVAHNLCTMNSLVGESDRLYSLGFLTKAFGLWYANVETLCGMTQWDSPALKLHSYYGDFQVLTAYTPVHSYPQTMTYSCEINFRNWPQFYCDSESTGGSSSFVGGGLGSTSGGSGSSGGNTFVSAGAVDRGSEKSMKALQLQIEEGLGPFYLDPNEIREKPLDASLNFYKRK